MSQVWHSASLLIIAWVVWLSIITAPIYRLKKAFLRRRQFAFLRLERLIELTTYV